MTLPLQLVSSDIVTPLSPPPVLLPLYFQNLKNRLCRCYCGKTQRKIPEKGVEKFSEEFYSSWIARRKGEDQRKRAPLSLVLDECKKKGFNPSFLLSQHAWTRKKKLDRWVFLPLVAEQFGWSWPIPFPTWPVVPLSNPSATRRRFSLHVCAAKVVQVGLRAKSIWLYPRHGSLIIDILTIWNPIEYLYLFAYS